MPLPRPVWLLGWVSFFTDTASEMIYPLMPLFLTRVLGAGFTEHLQKPVDPEELCRLVAKVAGR